jgi:hypothetical protein
MYSALYSNFRPYTATFYTEEYTADYTADYTASLPVGTIRARRPPTEMPETIASAVARAIAL